ncbi:MAG TPA: glycerophosphodiester phosphodiesterase family protein [Opitutaceae bacterium]|nr:glycerophosphodiester phosphodiesterase family protein [Opitutaceae bacterium]
MSEPKSPGLDPARRLLRASRTLVIGHRGARAVAPENTLPSFEAALAAGVDLVEFDYRHTSDGMPVVVHDATVERTTDARRIWKGRGMTVAGRTLADLRKLDAGSWMNARFAGTRLPTLEEALDAITPRAMPLIERKAGDAATCAQILQEKSLVDGVVVIAFDWSFLRELKSLAPGLVLGALGPSSANGRGPLRAAMLDAILRMGIDLVVWNNRVSRVSIAAAHARGMRVWVYTVNDPGEAVGLAEIGVDGIITDNPEPIGHALERRA